MRKPFKTTKFSLHLWKDLTSGTVWLADARHKLSLGLGGQNFKHLDEIPAKIRKLLQKAEKRNKSRSTAGTAR